MRVIVTPSELHVDPILLGGRIIHGVPKVLKNTEQIFHTTFQNFIMKTIIQLHNKVFKFFSYFVSAKRDGLETFHLYAENNNMSAQDEFIL